VIDGNTLNVTNNPFTFGPLTVRNHSVTLEGVTAPIMISACAVPTPTPKP
jgi:hypothetical protein